MNENVQKQLAKRQFATWNGDSGVCRRNHEGSEGVRLKGLQRVQKGPCELDNRVFSILLSCPFDVLVHLRGSQVESRRVDPPAPTNDPTVFRAIPNMKRLQRFIDNHYGLARFTSRIFRSRRSAVGWMPSRLNSVELCAWKICIVGRFTGAI